MFVGAVHAAQCADSYMQPGNFSGHAKVCHKWASCLAAFGLKWKSLGSMRPINASWSDELFDYKLANALLKKTSFNQQEWNAFGINNLHKNNYIKSGTSYFQPIVHDRLETMRMTLEAMGAAQAERPASTSLLQINTGACPA